jgi:anti-sigma B factor antagonist
MPHRGGHRSGELIMIRSERGPSGELLRFEREYAQGAVLFHFSGDIDLSNVPLLWSNLKAACEDGHNVIVDLSGVTYMDSTGLKALLDCHNIFLERGQRLAIADPPTVLLKILNTVGLRNSIPIFPSIEAAASAFRSSEIHEVK